MSLVSVCRLNLGGRSCSSLYDDTRRPAVLIVLYVRTIAVERPIPEPHPQPESDNSSKILERASQRCSRHDLHRSLNSKHNRTAQLFIKRLSSRRNRRAPSKRILPNRRMITLLHCPCGLWTSVTTFTTRSTLLR